MKITLIGLVLFLAFVNIQCTNYFGRTKLHHDVSIWLPSDFAQVEISSDYKNTAYKSSNNKDELKVASHFFKSFDSLSTERKEEIVEKNLENICKSVTGYNVKKQNLRTIKSTIENEYSMIFEKNDSSVVLYAKVMNKGPNILLLEFYTPFPATKASIKTKNKIFKSVKIK